MKFTISGMTTTQSALLDLVNDIINDIMNTTALSFIPIITVQPITTYSKKS